MEVVKHILANIITSGIRNHSATPSDGIEDMLCLLFLHSCHCHATWNDIDSCIHIETPRMKLVVD